MSERVQQRLEDIQSRIAAAARRAGRSVDTVRLVAVSKRQPEARLLAAYEAGARDFGENTVQSLVQHATFMRDQGCHDVRWHFIGHLQRNKINALLPWVSMVQSVDRAALVEALGTRVQKPLDVLVQVNIGRESQKSGVMPEAALELCRQVAETPRLRLRGLMVIPPAEQPEVHFKAMQTLHERVRAQPWGMEAIELSMGMSQDFEVAVVYGATLVRVGTAIFGPRQS